MPASRAGNYSGLLRNLRAMAVTKLSDGQKAELVERFRGGAGTQELAEIYGCSANTVSRVVRTALDPAEYESLKQSRNRRPAQAESAASPPEPAASSPAAASSRSVPEREIPAQATTAADRHADDSSLHGGSGALAANGLEEEDDDDTGVLAIDDADDFGDDDDDGDDDDLDDEDNVFVAVAPGLIVDDHRSCNPIPLLEADLPPRAYMLVEKTVELQPRPLSDFPELGRLADGEAERQALVLYLNPGQAKRQCGRSQRVIPIPATTALLERTAAKLRERHGITRVVIEGALYALPGC